jgi:hypothetical protein
MQIVLLRVGELKRYMITKHGTEAVNECFAGIQNIILNSLRSVANVIINDKHCFEVWARVCCVCCETVLTSLRTVVALGETGRACTAAWDPSCAS